MADFHNAAYAIHGIADPYLKEENLGIYGIERIIGMSEEEFYKPIGKDFWANLPRTKEFDEILAIVEEEFKPENICILTAPPKVKNPGCLEGKEEWIYKNLPRYKDQFLIGKPKYFCSGPDCLLIDDSDANCKAFHDKDGLTFLVPRAWNPLYCYRRFPAYHLREFLHIYAL